MRELKLSQPETGPIHPYVIFTGVDFIVQSATVSVRAHTRTRYINITILKHRNFPTVYKNGKIVFFIILVHTAEQILQH